MIALGLECTAHTLGISILKDKKFLCNLKDSYTTEKGGMIPDEAAQHHKRIAPILFDEVIKKSNINPKSIDIMAFSNAPGMPPCLIEGMRFIKSIAKKYKTPLLGVNHCISHLEIGKFVTKAKDPVLLYASGANTQIIAYEANKYRIFGETLDQGVGNFIDSFARYIGLGFPGGPKIYNLSLKSNKYIELPYSVKGMDVSFTGILTNLKQKYDKKVPVEDLSYSLQETVFAMLMEVSERAMAHCDKKELLLGGGVACNIRLQEMAKIMCKERKAKCFIPENQFLVDNAAMIAVLGEKMYKAGYKVQPIEKIDINPSQRTDQVEISW